MNEPKVIVVDDDEGVRDSLQALLEAQGYSVITFDAAEPFLDQAGDLEAHCVLLDVRLPDTDGLAVQEALRAQGLDFPVIVMTGYGDVASAVAAMKAGARDFIEKPFQPEQLSMAVAEAAATAAQAQSAARGTAINLEVLTPREREVLDLLVEGLPNKMVARRLGISPRTAEVHRANLMRKLEASSFSHLIRIALSAR